MEFKTTVDDIDFIFDEVLFEEELKRLLLRYKYGYTHCFLSLLRLDNVDVREILVERLKENIDNLQALDFSMKDIRLKDTNKYIKEYKVPVIMYNLEKYYPIYGSTLSTSVFASQFDTDAWLEFKNKFATTEELGRHFVFYALNMTRDGVFLENNAAFFLVLSDEDYLEFTYDVGDDFASYCQTKPDFNSCFINDKGISLSEYYKEKALSKILKR